MNFNKQIGFLVLAAWLALASCAKKDAEISKTNDPVEARVDSLLALMTLEEKVGQLVQSTSRWELTGPVPAQENAQLLLEQIKKGEIGSMLNVTGANAVREAQKLAVENSRLGIPMVFGYDVIHGYKTMFPIPLGETASWEPELARASAAVAADEAAAAGISWTFAPMVDVSRDARWGRSMEGAGEDTYLGTVFAGARVHGFQGDNLASISTVAACAKHFAAYGFIGSGRDYNGVELSDYTLHNVVLPPFKACVDAGVATFMNSFNEIGGLPSTANENLQRTILKGEWGFDGFMVSDWGSIVEMIAHGVAATPSDAAKLAIEAGSDMDMEGNCYGTSLVKLVNDGKVDVKLIDDAVRRVLRVKFRLGLFDNPYLYCDSVREKERTLTPTNLALSRQIAKRSIVLLKNDKQILPLETKFKRVAVIGQLAADKDSPLGSWRAKAETLSAVSVLEGLRTAYAEKGVAVTYARGPEYTDSVNVFSKEVRINTTDRAGLPEAVALAKNSDAVVLVLGENCYQSGEGRSQVEIGLKGLQLELFEAVVKANPNVVLVLMNGRPLDLSAVVGKVPAIVEAWHLGSESGNAIADVLTGAYNPSGKLPMSFPRSVGQVPIYYNANNTGRPNPGDVFWSHYTDSPNTPLFPFGFGLSYTTFEYSDLSLSANKLTSDKPLTISVKVSNKGARDGEEVVQLYVRDLVGSIARPVKELKGFRKVAIKAGETKEVKFEISAKDLAFYTRAKKWETEAGDFTLWVGTNSTEGLTANFAY